MHKRSLSRAVLTLCFGSAASQLILIGAMPLLTRLYSPKDFGLLAVFSSIVAIPLVLSSLRYELAIAIPKCSKHARYLLIIALFLNAAIAALTIPLVAFFKFFFADLLKAPDVASWMWFLPLYVFFAGTFRAYNYWAVRNADYHVISKAKIMQSLATVLTQLIAVFIGVGGVGLIIGQFFGQAIGAARLRKGSGLIAACSKTRCFFLRLISLLRKHERFPKYDVAASVVDILSTQLPNFLLAVFFGPSVAGLYFLAERAVLVPMSLVGQSVGQALLGESREAIRSGELENLLRTTIVRLFAIALFPSVILFFWGRELFLFFFGSSWQEAGLYSSWLIFGLLIQFIYSPISIVLVATNGQHLNLFIHLCMVIGKATAIFYGYYMSSALTAVVAFSFIGFFGYLFAINLILYHVKRHKAQFNFL